MADFATNEDDRFRCGMTFGSIAASAAGSDASTHAARFEAGEARSVAGVVDADGNG